MCREIYLLIAVILVHESIGTQVRQNARTFPEGFKFGAATAAYQVEGAWNEDGRSPSIWDHLTHTNACVIKDCSNGDVASNSYYNYKRDVEMLRELGVDFYRFSLSWPRLLPTAFPDNVNELAVEYYNNLIDELIKYNIEPIATLYHWDLPQKLQELGGWTNPHIIDWYADYALTAFKLFGDKVKIWNTMNEPHQVCYQGYGETLKAPMFNIKGVAEYLCTKNLLLAHAKAYHIYDEQFRRSDEDKIFITFSAQWYEPATEDDADVIAAEDANQFMWGFFVHPIYSETGGYPPVAIEKIAAKSEAQGFLRSRLPELSPEEIEYVRGTSDLFGLNHYISHLVYRNESLKNYYDVPSLMDDLEAATYQKEEWLIGVNGTYTPWGFYNLLTKIREDYNNPSLIMIENGLGTQTGLEDDDRVTYYKAYISAMLDAIDDGSNIVGYSAWSLMDNFEWIWGYTVRYGLYEVDFESPERTRTPRKSAFVYKEIVRSKSLDLDYEPQSNVMQIDNN